MAKVSYSPGVSMGHKETVPWEDSVNPYGDPTASNRQRWQFANGAGARFGSTPAQRAGQEPGYTPGVGLVAQAKPTRTPDADWNAKFAPVVRTQPTANPYGDWRGQTGVAYPPPITNRLPGDAGTNSLATPTQASVARDPGFVTTTPEQAAAIARKYATTQPAAVTKITPAVDTTSRMQMNPYA